MESESEERERRAEQCNASTILLSALLPAGRYPTKMPPRKDGAKTLAVVIVDRLSIPDPRR